MSPKTTVDLLRERLTEALEGLPRGEAAAKLGVDPKTLLNWRTGKSMPRADELLALASLAGRHPGWFFEAVSSPANDTVRISVLDVRAAAGLGRFNDRAQEVETIEWPRAFLRRLGANPRATDSLRATGDSMFPTIEDGAFLLIDRSQNDLPPVRGSSKRRMPDIYVFVQGNDLRLKRVERLPRDLLALISDNYAAHPPEIVDVGKIKIIGKVVWWDNRL